MKGQPGMPRFRCLLVLCLGLAFLHPASPEETAAGAYVVAVAGFASSGLPSAYQLFLSSLPRLLVAELSVLPPHHDEADYLAELGARTKGSSMYAAGTELAKSLDDLALRGLEPGIVPWQRDLNLKEARDKMSSARDKLNGLVEGKPAENGKQAPGTGLEPTAPLDSRLWDDNSKGLLYESSPAPSGAALKGKKIDLLVYGSVEAIGDYVSVVIRGYDADLDRDVFTWQDYASPSDPSPLARDLADKISSYIAGKSYARIDLDVSPASAEVRANGRLLSSGERRIFLFGEEPVLVSATAPDRSSCETRVEVKAGDRKRISLELPPFSTGKVTITTDPDGLSIFLDGLPLGASPVTASIPGRRSVASAYIEEEGKVKASASVILPDSGEHALAIKPDTGSRDMRKKVEKAKDDFYRALGWLMLALPPTTICQGLNSLYYGVSSEKYEYSSLALALMGTLSGGLAVNAIVRLTGYISAAR